LVVESHQFEVASGLHDSWVLDSFYTKFHSSVLFCTFRTKNGGCTHDVDVSSAIFKPAGVANKALVFNLLIVFNEEAVLSDESLTFNHSTVVEVFRHDDAEKAVYWH